MERKRSSCPLHACEKMFKAIASRSPFRHVSQYPQDPIAISARHHKPPKTIGAAEVVPVKFKHSGLPTYAPVQKNGKVANNIAPRMEPPLMDEHVIRKGVAQPGNTVVPPGHGQAVVVASRIEPESSVLPGKNKTRAEKIPQVNRMGSNKSGANADERFTNFINRAKLKIRSTPSNLGDGFKSRTTSKVGGDGEIVSGEGNSQERFSDYINRVKLKMMRTASSFGGGKKEFDSMK